MRNVDNPTLRLIPYLAAITVTAYIGLSVGNVTGDLVLRLLLAVVTYFGTYYLVRYIIGLIVRNRRDELDERNDDEE